MDDWIRRFFELQGDDRVEFALVWLCVLMRRGRWKGIGYKDDFWARQFRRVRDKYN